MPAPVVVNAGLIPEGVQAQMAPALGQGWFGPQGVTMHLLHQVFVAEEGLVLEADGTVLRPTVHQHTEAAVQLARDAVAAVRRSGRVEVLRGTAVLCRKPGTANYGHWLVEMLPAAFHAVQHWPERLRVMVQLVEEPLRQVVRDSLARLGVGGAQVAEVGRQPVLVERLLVVDGLTSHGNYLSPLAMDTLDRVGARVAAAGSERLLVLRPPRATRQMRGQETLVARAVAAGFDVIDPAGLPLAGQIAAFKAARLVAGTMGAALTNAAWCAPGAELRVLTPAAMPDTFFWFIAGLRGLRYREIRCDAIGPRRSDLEWDRALDPAEADLAALLAPPDPGAAPLPGVELARHHDDGFDAAAYLDANPDVAAAGCDPLWHYRVAGWREGRAKAGPE